MRIRACEPACQGFKLRNLATGHGESFYTPAASRADRTQPEVSQ
jgi:hypothetical protein